MTTIKSLALEQGKAPATVKRLLSRRGFKIGINDPLPSKAIDLIKPEKAVQNRDMRGEQRSHRAKESDKASLLFRTLPVLSLLSCGIMCACGGYDFLKYFAGSESWVPLIGAGGMVSVYVSISGMKELSGKTLEMALRLSLAAMWLSIVFNVTSVAMFAPAQMQEMNFFLFWGLCILRGAPFSIMCYHMANFIMTKK